MDGAVQKAVLLFAVTALFTQQTAVFASFSPNADVRLPNLISGMGAAAIVTEISIGLIVYGNKLNRIQRLLQMPFYVSEK